MKPHDIDVSDRCSAIRFTNLGGDDPCKSNPKVQCRHLGWLAFYTGVNQSERKLSALPYAGGSDAVFEGEPRPYVLGRENNTVEIQIASANQAPAHAKFRVDLSPNLEFDDGSHSRTDTIEAPERKIYKFRLISTASCPLPFQTQEAAKFPEKSAPSSADPIIKIRDQTGKDITNTTQAVGMGEKVALVSECINPSGTAILRREWEAREGLTIGAYEETQGKGLATEADFSKPEVTFYWVSPGDHNAIEAACMLNNGHTGKAAVTYNVDGPKNIAVDVDLGEATIRKPDPGEFVKPGSLFLQFWTDNGLLGYPLHVNRPGLWATPRATTLPVQHRGHFEWVQLIDKDVETRALRNGTTQTCSNGTGLDNDAPYPFVAGYAPTISDAPGIELSEPGMKPNDEYISGSRRFYAHAYLMWKPEKEDAIRVPLGEFSWSWAGEARLKETLDEDGITSPANWDLVSHTKRLINFKEGFGRFPEWKTRNVNGKCK